ncbi:hypothetical protein [Pseudomonas petrae]|uniref:hypothetical protein n=1 Tax=Pseudomonas petrae TaxID=2912190 RepID=UPI001F411DD0|nr:hypothetical protein [Pseudomonas petrae]MCF7536180.1 hypothetical protein [Pseudomonas petrae]
MNQTIFVKDGYKMRSHSETRWAGMMDALRIDWHYEPQLVKTRHGYYLPDFYLPRAEIFVEVKGPRPTTVEIEKATDAGLVTGRRAVIVCGDMNLSYPGVGGGEIFVCSKRGPVRYSTFEFHQAILLGLGDETYKRYLHAGMKQSRSWCYSAAEIMDEVLMEKMERGDQERYLASIAKPINAAKAARDTLTTPAEWALIRFFEVIRSKEAAA